MGEKPFYEPTKGVWSSGTLMSSKDRRDDRMIFMS